MKKLFALLVSVVASIVFIGIALSPVCDGDVCTYVRTTKTPVIYTEATPMKRVIYEPTPTSEVVSHPNPTTEVITHKNE